MDKKELLGRCVLVDFSRVIVKGLDLLIWHLHLIFMMDLSFLIGPTSVHCGRVDAIDDVFMINDVFVIIDEIFLIS
jgi:hypothetical protein